MSAIALAVRRFRHFKGTPQGPLSWASVAGHMSMRWDDLLKFFPHAESETEEDEIGVPTGRMFESWLVGVKAANGERHYTKPKPVRLAAVAEFLISEGFLLPEQLMGRGQLLALGPYVGEFLNQAGSPARPKFAGELIARRTSDYICTDQVIVPAGGWEDRALFFEIQKRRYFFLKRMESPSRFAERIHEGVPNSVSFEWGWANSLARDSLIAFFKGQTSAAALSIFDLDIENEVVSRIVAVDMSGGHRATLGVQSTEYFEANSIYLADVLSLFINNLEMSLGNKRISFKKNRLGYLSRENLKYIYENDNNENMDQNILDSMLYEATLRYIDSLDPDEIFDLMSKGANVSKIDPTNGTSPLHLLALNNCIFELEEICKNPGVDFLVRDQEGFLPSERAHHPLAIEHLVGAEVLQAKAQGIGAHALVQGSPRKPPAPTC